LLLLRDDAEDDENMDWWECGCLSVVRNATETRPKCGPQVGAREIQLSNTKCKYNQLTVVD
jgi:hypothetical protein